MVFNEGLNWFEGSQALADGKAIRVYVSLDATSGADRALADAGVVLPVLLGKVDEGKRFAASKLLEVKNDSWLENDEDPIDEAGFTSAMALSSVAIYAGHECELSYSDGELFWGHTIVLSWHPDRSFHDANIAG